MDAFWAVKRRVAELFWAWKSSPRSNFEYSPLPVDTDTAYIRLLELRDGGPGDILRCHLYEANLESDPSPVYEAVSYSWRRDVLMNSFVLTISKLIPWFMSQEHSVEEVSLCRVIICNGKILRIQPNLYDLLLRLRQQRRGLPLWVDAICINQDESDHQAREEKYRQIRLMREIYGSAARVLVWLGESTNISNNLPKIIDEIPSLGIQYEDFRSENNILGVKTGFSIMEIWIKTLGLEGSFWTMIRNAYRRWPVFQFFKLANRDYFQRVWVVQELVLAKELQFLVGPVHLSWEAIQKGHQMIAAFNLQATRQLSELQKQGFLVLSHIMKAREDYEAGNPWTIDDFLLVLRDRVATCPEDKVFSILGLIDSKVADELTNGVMHEGRPYLPQLYLNCTVVMAQEKGWPYVFSLAALGFSESSDLASWVPDFRKSLHPKPFWYNGINHLRACAGINTLLPGDFTVLSDLSGSAPRWTLQVPLAVVDVVVQVGESYSELDKSHSSHMQGHILDLLTRLGLRYNSTGELTLDALFRTLTADVFSQDPDRNMVHLRLGFYFWFKDIFGQIESSALPKSSHSSNRHATRDAPNINGEDLSLKLVIDDFVQIHDSAAYPVGSILHRKVASRQLVPEAPPNREALEGVGLPQVSWEGGFSVAKLLDLANRVEKVGITRVSTAISQIYNGRRVFRTSRGYLGCGPSDVRLGDLICLTSGEAHTPFLFRRDGEERVFRASVQSIPQSKSLGRLRLVGEAYVHGIMSGELAEEFKTSIAVVVVA